jgi:O-antigen ligase
MVLGQFGYLGLFSYLGIVYFFFTLFLKQIKNKFNTTNFRYVPLLGLILLLIDSSSDSIFTQSRAVAIFMIFALFTNIQRNITHQDEKY